MTGGQHNEGDLDPARIAHEVRPWACKNIALVYDPKEEIDWSTFPRDLERFERDDLMTVQERFQELEGVSAIIYIQTCAAEKRRRRKRGTFPDIDRRVFINTDVCEGCGDCGVQSNCVSIVPVETELGRKRAIDQSTCNKDFSCLKGFCPSFVTVEGGTPKKEATAEVDLSGLPEPAIPAIAGTHNIVITGVGGTGVVTIGANLAMAAHIEGKGAAMMEMAGLAQKGGAVHIHVRIAEGPDDISAIRVATGRMQHADRRRSGGLGRRQDAGPDDHGPERRGGQQPRDRHRRFHPRHRVPHPRRGPRARAAGASSGRSEPLRRLGSCPKAPGRHDLHQPDASGRGLADGADPALARGDPEAVALNGAAVERNKQAFEMGRWAIVNPEAAARLITSEVVEKPKSLEEKIAFRADHLTAYQGKRLARRYRKLVDADRPIRA
jgi:indolepyruvate ferredoxin oxidoreductase